MVRFAFISQPEYFRFVYENDLRELAEVREFQFKFEMKEEEFRDLLEFNADYNFFFRGEFVPDTILAKLDGLKICLSSEPFPSVIKGKLNLSRDSYCRYKQFKRIAVKKFDYLFHYDNSSLQFFQSENFNICGIFPFPVATEVYTKKDLKKKWDLFFIGRSTPHREKLFFPLKHKHNFLHICHGIWGAELVQYANESKILLNVHAENEISWEPRLQMLMATGNMVISEKISPNTLLVPGRDYVEIHNQKELIEACEYYLHNEKERNSIAVNGFNVVRDLLDSKTTFEKFTKDIKNNVYPRFNNARIPPRNYKMELYSLFLSLMAFVNSNLSSQNEKKFDFDCRSGRSASIGNPQ